MASREIELREYLMNKCPITQDEYNPKVYAHLRGISGYDYLICDFKDGYGYCLILHDEHSLFKEKYDYIGVEMESLLEDKVIIIYKSKYLGKKTNKIIKRIIKGAQ